MPATRSTHKRYTQLQLTQIFVQQGNLPVGETSQYQRAWWMNPTDPNSLRLTLQGLQFVKAILKIQSYEFALPDELTNHNLLQLERTFRGMYYLLKRHKIILFEEEEALMVTLHGNDLKTYLDNLESQG